MGLSDVSSHPADASLLVVGVFLGSAFWWLILSEGITLFRHKINKKFMTWISRIAGILIFSFGLAALLSDI